MSAEVIFCSRCGAEGQRTNTYCKRCGEWLQDLSGRPSRIDVIGGQTPELKAKGLANNSIVSVVLALFAGVAVLISLDSTDSPFFVFVPLACVIVAALQMINFVVSRKMRNDLQRGRQTAIPGPHANNQLTEVKPEDFSGLSVTEHTTRTLEPARKIDSSQ